MLNSQAVHIVVLGTEAQASQAQKFVNGFLNHGHDALYVELIPLEDSKWSAPGLHLQQCNGVLSFEALPLSMLAGNYRGRSGYWRLMWRATLDSGITFLDPVEAVQRLRSAECACKDMECEHVPQRNDIAQALESGYQQLLAFASRRIHTVVDALDAVEVQ